jgi:phospholipid transport system substrate-binding protein
MLVNQDTTSTLKQADGLRRRSLLSAAVLLVAVPLSGRAFAGASKAEPPQADATATIKQFNAALLATMKSGGQTDFAHRFQALAPAVDKAFDLPAVLAISVGPSWASLSSEQQSRLLAAFRRYTVASYVANFDSYSGQTFTVSPETRALDADRVVVSSSIKPVNGEATALDYVMTQTQSGWKIVDVLAAGSISRVAVQRSDFRHLLSKGGGDALLASLQRKAADLSGDEPA